MKKLLTFIIIISVLISCADKNKPIRIACIGDSITEGYGHKCPSKTCWPVVLNQLLGVDYIVQNYGRSGTTMQSDNDYSYWKTCEFSNALSLKPNIVIIKLGTNDTKTRLWNMDRFRAEYQTLIDTFLKFKPKPRIILCNPVPAFDTIWTINDSTITNGVIPVIEDLAKRNRLELIDFHHIMKEDSANFPDKIHPDEIAANKMAHIIYNQIKNENNL